MLAKVGCRQLLPQETDILDTHSVELSALYAFPIKCTIYMRCLDIGKEWNKYSSPQLGSVSDSHERNRTYHLELPLAPFFLHFPERTTHLLIFGFDFRFSIGHFHDCLSRSLFTGDLLYLRPSNDMLSAISEYRRHLVFVPHVIHG